MTIVLAASVIGTMAACGGQPLSQLRMPGSPPQAFGQTIVAPNSGATISVGDMSLCVDGESALVTAVRFDEGNLPVTAFGIRILDKGESALGYMPDTLVANGFAEDVAPVTTRCQEAEKPGVGRTELAISVATPSEVSEAKDLVITYEAGNDRGELRLPFGLKVCPPSKPGPCHQPRS